MDKDGDFISCRLFIVKELGVDECLGFYAPPMIDNNNTTLADLFENGEPTIYYIMKPILQISGVFWTKGLTILSGW
nr:hypothetical protein [Helicobacter pylori]